MLTVVVIVLSTLVAARIALVDHGPVAGPRVIDDHVGFLEASIGRGDGAAMQRLFPEGAFFLTGYPNQFWPCDSVVGAAALARAAQLLGLPVPGAGGRRYAFGLLPVGDAFLAWARGQESVNPPVVTDGPGDPLWPVLILLALTPGLLIAAFWWRPRGSQP